MECDDLVIGSGMAGLAVASLLARSGRRTIVLEAHDVPGGWMANATAGLPSVAGAIGAGMRLYGELTGDVV